jgi:hypothetical protein
MTYKRNGGRHPPPLGATRWRTAATGNRFVSRVARLVLDRAIKKAVQSIERQPPTDACLPRDIGLTRTDAERLASQLQVLAADPFHKA